jgi:hypothetical protein
MSLSSGAYVNEVAYRGALAMLALQGSATALRKAHPELSEAQAFARVYVDPANRIAANAEREASRARLIGGAPVARTSAEVLNDLSDDAIHALVDEIRRGNPFLDDAGIVRLLVQGVEAPGYRGDVAAARRAGNHAPGPYEDLTGRRLMSLDEPALKRDSAMAELNAKAAELRKSNPRLTPEQAFAKVYRLEPGLAAREQRGAGCALCVKVRRLWASEGAAEGRSKHPQPEGGASSLAPSGILFNGICKRRL